MRESPRELLEWLKVQKMYPDSFGEKDKFLTIDNREVDLRGLKDKEIDTCLWYPTIEQLIAVLIRRWKLRSASSPISIEMMELERDFYMITFGVKGEGTAHSGAGITPLLALIRAVRNREEVLVSG